MNTVSHSEVHAVADTSTALAVAGAPDAVTTIEPAGGYQLHLIALSRLRPSNRNVRRSGGTAIPELAASIARVGLLQNLSVVAAPDGESFEVVAGRRRLAALKLLVKRRKLGRDHPVPCLLVPDGSARTVSLTENVQRQAMSPVEELVAWKALAAEGRAIEDIAADFGVTPLVVRRRLRLANCSPRLLADCEQGEVSLEQLMALAITDDHAAQEAAFYESPHWQRDPEALRAHLMREEVEAARDPVARFVGLDAYEQAGGAVRRDLFADEGGGVFMADAALLDALAKDRLAATVRQVQEEGWGWVEAAPRAAAADLHRFQRIRAVRRAPKRAEARRIAKLQAAQNELQQRLDDEEAALSDEGAQSLHEEIERLGQALEAMEQALKVYAPGAVEKAGAIVTLDREGSIAVHRGLLREDDARALRALERSRRDGACASPDGEDGATSSGAAPKGGGLSEKLVLRLSAHRTAALQAEVARHPRVALAVLVHLLAQEAIFDGQRSSPVQVTAKPQDRLAQHASDIDESPALAGLRQLQQAWAQRLPQDGEALFAELLAMPQEEVLNLLATCVGLCVSALTSRADDQPAAPLARAVQLDMHAWWTPTAAGYFSHVTKAKVLEAVRAFAPQEALVLSKLKKDRLAAEAQRLAAGSGWLPAMFLLSTAGGEGDAASTGEDAEAEAEQEADEGAQVPA